MQVKQVVTNLLVNAIKFSPVGGRVRLAIRMAAPEGSSVGPSARSSAELVVGDEGPGIPEGDRQRVFERGFRLDRDQRVAGSGIGLAVVREIVAAHRGTVQATEAAGGGAALVVRLPLDMRARRDSSVVFVDDAAAAERLVSELRAYRGGGGVQSLRDAAADLAAILETCRAVVVMPRSPRGTIDGLLDRTITLPPADEGKR
jgi:hypothetical protein